MSPGTDNCVPADSGVTIIRQVTHDIVLCKGRITSDTVHSLKTTVKPLFFESKTVVLDLTEVSYVDSSGLGAIVGLYISAIKSKCRLKIIYSNDRLKQLFRLTKLDQLLTQDA